MKNDVSLTLAQPSVHCLGEVPSFQPSEEALAEPKCALCAQEFIKVSLSFQPRPHGGGAGVQGGSWMRAPGNEGEERMNGKWSDAEQGLDLYEGCTHMSFNVQEGVN